MLPPISHQLGAAGAGAGGAGAGTGGAGGAGVGAGVGAGAGAGAGGAGAGAGGAGGASTRIVAAMPSILNSKVPATPTAVVKVTFLLEWPAIVTPLVSIAAASSARDTS